MANFLKWIGGGINKGLDNAFSKGSGGLLRADQLDPQQRGAARGAALYDIGGLIASHGQQDPNSAGFMAANVLADRKRQEDEAALRQQQANQRVQQQLYGQAYDQGGPQTAAAFALRQGNIPLANATREMIQTAPQREVTGAPVELNLGGSTVLANRFKDGTLEVIPGAQRPSKWEPFENANGDKEFFDVNNLSAGTVIKQSPTGPVIENDRGVFRLKGDTAVPVTTPDGQQVTPTPKVQLTEINGVPHVVSLLDGKAKAVRGEDGQPFPVAQKAPADPVEKFGFVNTIVEQARTRIEPFVQAAQAADLFARAYKEQKESLGKNAAADIAMITKFMKVLDPGSVVRESEFAIAQKARAMFDYFEVLQGQAAHGQAMSSQQRDAFGRMIEEFQQGARAQAKADIDQANKKVDLYFRDDPDKEAIRGLVIRDPFAGTLDMSTLMAPESGASTAAPRSAQESRNFLRGFGGRGQ